MDHLQQFFDSLSSEGDLERLRAEAREEDLHLEFKSKVDSRNARLDEGDREAFSKAVSGFANADGGVLVFGVKTRKSGEAPDRASELHPIEHVQNFRIRLQDSILQTTQPSVDGVLIAAVPSAGNTGYVKCLIPASDKPPHRAMFANREYWRRTSQGFRRMEHYELEDVFGRRLRPVLRLRVHFVRDQSNLQQHALRFMFRNVGRGVARYSGFTCFITNARPVAFAGISGLQDLSSLNNVPAVGFVDNVGVVHPNEIYTSLGQVTIIRENGDDPLNLALKWYAENMTMREMRIDMSVGDEAEG